MRQTRPDTQMIASNFTDTQKQTDYDEGRECFVTHTSTRGYEKRINKTFIRQINSRGDLH